MATQESTSNYILDQLSSRRDVSTRKMFGEYALYYSGKVVGLICDDSLFIKITDEGKSFVGEYYREGPAYPGAKPSMQINPDQLEDHRWLSELVQITWDNLPEAKPKKKKQ